MTDEIKGSEWNEPTSTPSTVKGKKGLQRKPTTSGVTIAFRVTQAQADAIKTECKKRGVSISQLVRAGIACYVTVGQSDGTIDLNQYSLWTDPTDRIENDPDYSSHK